jgi:hypothetical protein
MATSRLLAPRHAIASFVARIALSWAFAAAAADTMRCRNGRLVNVGMLDAEVTALCGEPKSRTTQDVPVRSRGAGGGSVVVGTTRLERWTYERGQGEFDAVLSFEDGKLVRIDLLNTR